MSGVIEITYKETKSQQNNQYFSHDFFLTASTAEKNNKLAPLRQDYKLGLLEIKCLCNHTKPRMTIAFHSRSSNYSLRSFPNVTHAAECFFYKNDKSEIGTSISNKGILKTEQNEYIYHLDHHNYKAVNINSAQASSSATNVTTPKQIGISQRHSSVFALVKNIMTMSWNNCVKFNSDYPSTSLIEIQRQIVNYTIKKIKIDKLYLSSLFYNGGKEGAVYMIEKKYDQKYFAFTMLPLFDKDIQLHGDEYFLNLQNPQSIESRICRVKKDHLDIALKAIRNLPGPYYVGGFISKRDQKAPIFESIALIPISDYGTPIESTFERDLFNQLGKDKRKVQRPLESYHVNWNGFLPDGILIDTTPNTIIEVYGMNEGNVNYHLSKEKKREVFSNLSTYQYWEWEAYKGISIPRIPKINVL